MTLSLYLESMLLKCVYKCVWVCHDDTISDCHRPKWHLLLNMDIIRQPLPLCVCVTSWSTYVSRISMETTSCTACPKIKYWYSLHRKLFHSRVEAGWTERDRTADHVQAQQGDTVHVRMGLSMDTSQQRRANTDRPELWWSVIGAHSIW